MVHLSINGWLYISSAITYIHTFRHTLLIYISGLWSRPTLLLAVYILCPFDESSAQARGAVSIYTWRGTVPLPDISREEGLRTGLQSQEVFPMSDFLVALGVAFGSTLPVNRP